MGERYQQMLRWLEAGCSLRVESIQPASSDASFRRYWRVQGPSGTDSLIVMDAPPDRENCSAFVVVDGELRRCGLNVPDILAANLSEGFMLLSDLGNQSYLSVLHAGNVNRLYQDAMASLLTMQEQGNPHGLRHYDRELLLRELNIFVDWLLVKEVNFRPASAAQSLLTRTFDWLADRALEQPRVFVHRDFHSRNLMFLPHGNPGILDFQDAVLGPISYDLVSLLRDCYIDWPERQVQEWAHAYYLRARELKLLNGVSSEQFQCWFDLMGIQRHLKASGIFARLCHRDGKTGYLKDIPRTLRYVMTVTCRYPELSELRDLIEDKVLPMFQVSASL